MSSGLPIVCSNVYENPYIVEEGVNGFLFNLEDPVDIARVSRQMTSLSIEEREQMGGGRNRQLLTGKKHREGILTCLRTIN